MQANQSSPTLPPLQRIVWTIAGSDCSGGAGIQADIKAINNLGAEACSIITAVTAQNAFGVQAINTVADDVLLSQLHSLEDGKQAQVIKIGLLASPSQVRHVASFIAKAKRTWEEPPCIVYDPVAIATNGDSLTEEDILPAIKEHLLPLVDVLTPNNQEVQKLSGVYVFSWSCVESAAQALLDTGVKSVVIKGGHIDIDDNQVVDYATDGEQHYWLASPRIDTEHTHGTGCTFSSAIASLLAQGYLLRDAATIAKAYINQGLKAMTEYDGCYGPVWQGAWPDTLTDFPTILTPGSMLAEQLDWKTDEPTTFACGFATTDTTQLGLYPVVDSIVWIERLLNAGVKTLQYREKLLQGDALEDAIATVVALGKHHNARLFINDHWQLAIKHQAYGVHLGQEDLATANLAQIKAAGLRLGVSTHGHYELLKALSIQPSYLAVGAIFPTRTKDMTGQIQGIKTLADLVKLTPDTQPMVAIGGITHEKAPDVLNTGVGSIAVVTAITEADSPETSVATFLQLIDQHQASL